MTAAPTAASAPLPLQRDRDFRRYAAARVASLTGSAVTYIAMPTLIYQMTGSNFWTALVVVAEALPYLCIGLFAGALADRVDRRRVMVTSDLVNAVLLASVPTAYLLGGLTVPHALVVAFASQASFVFFDAANFGALPTLAGLDRLAAAQSTMFGASTVVELVVPGLAGAALAVLSPAPLLAVDAVSFVASALLIRAIVRPLWNADRPARTRRDLAAEIREGLGFLWRQPVVRINILVGMTQSFAGGAFVGQLVPWADQVLGVPPGDWRLGIIFTAWAVGGLGASVLYPRLSRWRGEAWVTLAVLPLSALGALACALAGDWWVAVGCVGSWGVVYVTTIINSITLRQRITPEHLQSRVNTTGRMLAYGVGSVSGALTAGVVSEAAGPRTALLMSVAVITAGAVAAWFSPLRRYGDLRQ